MERLLIHTSKWSESSKVSLVSLDNDKPKLFPNSKFVPNVSFWPGLWSANTFYFWSAKRSFCAPRVNGFALHIPDSDYVFLSCLNTPSQWQNVLGIFKYLKNLQNLDSYYEKQFKKRKNVNLSGVGFEPTQSYDYESLNLTP